MIDQQPEWMTFGELFAAAGARGLDLPATAAGLLANAQQPAMAGKIEALRRSWSLDDPGLVLECATRFEPVGRGEWLPFPGVESDLTATWPDSESEMEVAEQWARVDFYTGILTAVRWEWEPELTYQQVEYSTLRLHRSLAGALLDPLQSQAATISEGRPFSDSERRAFMIERSQRRGNVDDAHKEFKAHPRWDGTEQAEFRKEWRRVIRRGRGRPAKIRGGNS